MTVGLGLASDLLLWQALVLVVVSFVVGCLGGFVGLALGTMKASRDAAYGHGSAAGRGARTSWFPASPR